MLDAIYQLNTNRSDGKALDLRKSSLILFSFLPLILLFSRAIADALLTLIGIFFIINSFKTKDYSYIKQPVVITLILLWISFLLSSAFAFTDGTFSNKAGSFFISSSYLRFILFFTASNYWLLTEIKALKFAGTIITITLLLASIDALFQFITGFSIGGHPKWGERLTSFLRRPDIGIYLAKLVFPIASLWISLSVESGSKKNLVASLLFLFFIITIICLTGERTATILSLSALTLALLIIAIHNKNLRPYTIGAIVSLFAIFVSIIYKVPFIYQRLLDFVTDISNLQNSVYGQLFKASILSWYEYGIFSGVGIRQFRHSCLVFKDEGLVTYCDLHSHNIYLEILSETGLIGFTIFVIFGILCLRQVIISSMLSRNDTGKFTSSILAFSGLCTILSPIGMTMSFITNWSAILNWIGISFCFSLLLLNSTKK